MVGNHKINEKLKQIRYENCVAKSIKGIVLFLFFLFVLGCTAPKKIDNTSPNIIVFLVDDLGWNDTSLPMSGEKTKYNSRYRTPNLEKLASQGLTLTNARSNAICVPSRVSLLSGQSFMRHQVKGDIEPWVNTSKTLEFPKGKVVSSVENLLPARLKENGYRTIHAGKFHLCHICPTDVSPSPEMAGFDVNIGGSSYGAPGSYLAEDEYGNIKTPGRVPYLEHFYGEGTHLTEVLTQESLKEVKYSVDQNRPFFLYLAHYAVHTPIQPHEPYQNNYALLEGEPVQEGDYASMIEGVDASLGKIMKALDEWEIADNTLLIFYSDNGGRVLGRGQKSLYGEWEFNFPLRSGKVSLYEGGTKVPGVLRWPGKIMSNTVNDAPLLIEDIYSTVLEAAHVETANNYAIDGKSWFSIFKEVQDSKEIIGRDLFFFMPYRFDGEDFNGPDFAGGGVEAGSAVIHDEWKLIYFFMDERFELYDLSNDREEKYNLIDKEGEIAKKLVHKLDSKMKEHNVADVMPVRLPEKVPVNWPLDAWVNEN